MALSFIIDEGRCRALVELNSVWKVDGEQWKVERSLKVPQSKNSSNVSKDSDVPLVGLYVVPLPLIEGSR